MFVRTEFTDEKITMSNGRIMKPMVTLKWDTAGFKCQIVRHDGCYIVCSENPDGKYDESPYITKDIFDVLKTLPAP